MSGLLGKPLHTCYSWRKFCCGYGLRLSEQVPDTLCSHIYWLHQSSDSLSKDSKQTPHHRGRTCRKDEVSTNMESTFRFVRAYSQDLHALYRCTILNTILSKCTTSNRRVKRKCSTAQSKKGSCCSRCKSNAKYFEIQINPVLQTHSRKILIDQRQ